MRRFLGQDTEIGGHGKSFHSTRWSQLLSSAAGERSPSLRRLAQAYWRPIYFYIRMQRRLANEEAKDLTQQFFLWMVESGFLEKIRPGSGSFRGFLKTALANFLTDQHRAAHRQKRGGAAKIIPLDLSDEVQIEPADDRESPDRVLDRRWKESVIAQAMAEIEAHYDSQGKRSWVELWREYDLSAEAGKLDYAVLAAKYGITKREVSYWLTMVRRRFQEAVGSIVAETVGDEASLKAELRDLFGGG